MKPSNMDLSLALAECAMGRTEQTPMLQLADYLATNPTSKIFHERTLQTLGIDPHNVPSETWGQPIPDVENGSEELKKAIAMLNEFWGSTPLHKRIAVRRLAWAATLLARRLDADAEARNKYVIQRNNGSTAGLFRAHITPLSRSELQKTLTENQA